MNIISYTRFFVNIIRFNPYWELNFDKWKKWGNKVKEIKYKEKMKKNGKNKNGGAEGT